MIEVSPILLLALGELLLISIVVSLGLAVAGFVRKSNERKAIAKLIGRIKADEARRKSETRSLMQENFGYAGDQLESIVNKIAREEKRLYQALINLFLKRDVNLMEVLHVECEGVTEPYRTLEFPKVESGAEKDDGQLNDLEVEVVALKEENTRLSTELGITMNTMGTILIEYASKYAGPIDETDKNKTVEAPFVLDADDQVTESLQTMPDEDTKPGSAQPPTKEIDDTLTGDNQEFVQRESDQVDSGLFDDGDDLDIGEILGEQTVVLNGLEDVPELGDETLVMDVNDDELVELDDDDLDLDKTRLANDSTSASSENVKTRTG